ncbi:MAG: radical SAM protein [Microcystis sp. M020S1]|jgi:radical SAM protein with 4Fe4S-binding SPASM domain|uniref:radical SAM protein n=1 Tax=Microcystis sp. M099S2 TaxID=2771178 RepID=UPI00258AAD7A|nr:radical SAM protein [Microcystis sp. M099S2]MCA2620974.1 radical SAM protein [Microcystis sp. M099S2]MCA2925990.1 radical SAM protein [Microcystis sp. M020S1]
MAIAKEVNIRTQFINWLSNKQPFEYWGGANTSVNFADNLKQQLVTQLKSNILFPNHVTISVTNRCNLLCEHCGKNSGKPHPDEMSFAEILNLIPQLKQLQIRYISLSGGEPLTRRDIFDIIEVLKKADFKVGLISNGFINDERTIDKLNKSNIDTINISIDGLRETHNSVRKHEKSFDNAIKFLSLVHEYTGIKNKSIISCVSPGMLGDLEGLCETIFNLGATSWVLRPIAPTGRAEKNPQLLLSDSELKAFIQFCLNKIKEGVDLTIGGDVGYLGSLDSILRSTPYFPSIGWSDFQICANGDVRGLSEESVPIEGNIRDSKLTDIWHNGFKLYREFKVNKTCSECHYLQRCGGEFIPNSFIGQACLVARGIVD